jgi:transposase-like protein
MLLFFIKLFPDALSVHFARPTAERHPEENQIAGKTMSLVDENRESDNRRLYSPKEIRFLSDNDEAFRLVDSLRWKQHKTCPRCDSVFVKAVNTTIFRELYRCIDCGYMFNTLSGTVFQGAKIPLVKFFQIFIICDAMGKGISPRDISYAIEVSHKTAVSLITKLNLFGTHARFTAIDKKKFESLPVQGDLSSDDRSFESFYAYCDMKFIVVDIDEFRNYIAEILKIRLVKESIGSGAVANSS